MSSIVGRAITWGPVAPPALCCICTDPDRADVAAVVPVTANQQHGSRIRRREGKLLFAGGTIADRYRADFYVYVTCAIDAALAKLDHRHVRLDHLRKDCVSSLWQSRMSRERNGRIPRVVTP